MKIITLLMSLVILSSFSACSQKQKIVYVKVPCPKLQIFKEKIKDDFKPVKMEIEK